VRANYKLKAKKILFLSFSFHPFYQVPRTDKIQIFSNLLFCYLILGLQLAVALLHSPAKSNSRESRFFKETRIQCLKAALDILPKGKNIEHMDFYNTKLPRDSCRRSLTTASRSVKLSSMGTIKFVVVFMSDASSIPTCLILLDELLDCPVTVQRKEMGKLVQVTKRR
jgi:hypothetical protein